MPFADILDYAQFTAYIDPDTLVATQDNAIDLLEVRTAGFWNTGQVLNSRHIVDPVRACVWRRSKMLQTEGTVRVLSIQQHAALVI